ncbi:MAG: hypothetical protein JNL42_01870 [Anaerolineae bacterium]|nr:hypothetical protein [Anaerolineae bacterium]
MSNLIRRFTLVCAIFCACLQMLAVHLANDEAGVETVESSVRAGMGFEACVLPCYAGLTPGRTPFADAAALLTANIPLLTRHMLIDARTLRFEVEAPNAHLTGVVSNENGRVGSVQLRGIFSVRGLLADFGAPNCILAGSPSDAGGLHYLVWQIDGLLLRAAVDAQPRLLALDQESDGLWIGAGGSEACTGDLLPWHGFAPAWHYRGE